MKPRNVSRFTCHALLALWTILAPHVTAGADIKFEDVKGGSKSDPLGKNESLSFRLLFNNLSASGNAAFGNLVGLNPSLELFYGRDGKELAFSAYGGFGISTALDRATTPRTAIGESRAYVFEWGLDLNYIITNASSFFWSAGVAEHSHLGGVIIEQTAQRFSMIPAINLIGVNTRARFYPLHEFFLTGYMGLGFLSIYSRELQWYATGSGPSGVAADGLTTVDVESPVTFIFEFSGEYRPHAAMAFTTGVRYRSLTYKANDPSDATTSSVAKSFGYFAPFFGITLLY